jgi:tetratricopeptide (TPR) repeat protein
MTLPKRFSTAGACALLALATISCNLTPAGREAKHMAKGKDYLEKKDYKRAAIEFKVASQNAEKDAEPHYQLGMVYLGARAFPLAVTEFRKTLELKPKHELADFQLARLLANSNVPAEVEKSVETLNAYAKAHPKDADAPASLAVAQSRAGNIPAVTENLDRALSLNISDTSPAGAAVLIQLGKKNLDTAKEISAHEAAAFPKSADLAVLYSKVLILSGDRTAADAELARALSIDPKNRPALELRLSVLTGNKKISDAEETAKVLATLPDSASLAAYANYLLREGKIEPALQEYRKLVKDHPDDAALRDQFAATLMSLNRKEEASSVVDASLAKSAKDPDALLIEATLKIDANDYGAGEKILDAVDVARPNSAAAKYQRSRIYAARGETRKEGDLLVEALRLNPRLLAGRLELSRLLTEAGNTKGALALLDAAAPGER